MRQDLELLRGAIDIHVHSGPDLYPRIQDHFELARAARAAGLRALCIKSHNFPTAARAALARTSVSGIDVFGSINLNLHVGGLNPIAVEAAIKYGARQVWFPTVDAVNETAGRVDPAPGAKLPFWAKLQQQLRSEGVVSEPVAVVGDGGEVLPETRAVLRSIAKHDAILATAHLGRDEIFAVVEAAREEGVERIVVTHPEFPSQDLAIEDQVALAQMGALLERCFTTPYTGKCTWERIVVAVSAVGIENNLVTSDLGQPTAPPVEDGVALFADRLLAAGIAESDVRVMTVENPWTLARGRWRASERARR